MDESKKSSFKFRPVPTSAVAIVWFSLSLMVTIKLANAEDALDMRAAVPFALKSGYAIMLFPMNVAGLWEWLISHIGERPGLPIGMIGMLLNSFIWAYFLVSFFQLVMRRITTPLKRNETQVGIGASGK